MKILITQKQGYTSREGGVFPRGSEADFDERLAGKLIRYGIAVPVPEPEPKPKAKPKPPPVVETAEVEPPENAARRTSKPKPRKEVE